MFIGRLILNGNTVVLKTVDGEELILARHGKAEVISDSELEWMASEIQSLPEQRYVGIRIGNVLNVIRRDSPSGFFVRERIGAAIVNVRGVARGSKTTIVE